MRRLMITAMILLTVLMTGCSNQSSEDLKSQNVFQSFSTQKIDSVYQMKGTVYLSSERDLVAVQAGAGTEISLSGILKRINGEMKLLFVDADGNITTLIDSEDNQENTIDVDISLLLDEGNGRFYYTGTSCVFEFDLSFSSQEDVSYFLNNTPF